MAVHYKFKSAKDFDSVPLDGHCISVAALKEKIVLKQKLGSASDFDLVISNADTDEEYLDENFMINDNASVLVRRVPRKASAPAPEALVSETPVAVAPEEPATAEDPSPVEASAVSEPTQASEPTDEDIRIKEFVDSSAADWMRQTHDAAANARSNASCFQRKTPPSGYICHRCGVSGHFIQHCPTNGDSTFDIKKVRMPSGIPKTMLVADSDGTYALPNGEVAVLQPNEVAFAKEIDGVAPPEPLKEVPLELRCPLCQNALKDAVLTSKCCFKSFCDSCIRGILLEKSTCVCGAKNVRADDLLPNKTLRETVDRLLFGCSSLTNSSFSHKPQSQDSTTTNVETTNTVSTPSVDGKASEETPAAIEMNEELEEELDYDEEGFDDLNLDEVEADEEPSESPETSLGAPEKEARDEELKPEENKEEPKQPEKVEQQEAKEVNKKPASTQSQPAPVRRSPPPPVRQQPPPNRKRGNIHPYAVQYSGYWSASQMHCRPAYGYGGYFSPHFAPPVHFPVQPYAKSRAFVSRRRPEPDRRALPGGNVAPQSASDDCKQRGERRREPERSRSPRVCRRSSNSPRRTTRVKRERSSSPRRVWKRSGSPVRRTRSSNAERSRSRSPVSRCTERPAASFSPEKIRSRESEVLQRRGLRGKDKRQMLRRRSPGLVELQESEAPRLRVGRRIRSQSPEVFYGRDARYEEPEVEVRYVDAPEKQERILQGGRVIVKREECMVMPARAKSVLRAARGVEMEPRRLLHEFELSKRPRAPVIQKKRSLMMSKRGLVPRASPDDELLVDEEEYELQKPVQRGGLLRGRVEASFENEEYIDDDAGDVEDEVEAEDDVDEMLLQQGGRCRRRALQVSDDELGVDDEEVIPQQRGLKKSLLARLNNELGVDEEVVPQRGLKKSLLARLNMGSQPTPTRKRSLNVEQQAGQQRVMKKIKTGEIQGTKKMKQGKGAPQAPKSVFERISFSSKTSASRSCAAQKSGGGASGGSQRMVVFYGDV